MKLFHTPTSPFARKVRVVADLLGLPLETEVTPPMEDPPALLAANPLGKVPALVTEDGLTVFDSAVICQVLIEQGGGALIPAAGPARWRALRDEALADGISEAAVARTMERQRPDGERSPAWLARHTRAITRALDVAEADAPDPEAGLDLPKVALACALEYLDLRHEDLAWRTGRPRLTAWLAVVAEHPAMTATRPG